MTRFGFVFGIAIAMAAAACVFIGAAVGAREAMHYGSGALTALGLSQFVWRSPHRGRL